MESGRTSGVGTPPFEPWPDAAQVHVEWGPTGARLAGDRGDVVVIVDVLAFSTSVTTTVARGATALSYSADELDAMGGREHAAAALGAEIVAEDRAATTARVSLSPASLATIGPGDRLIFTSLNGAACTSAASNAPLVLIGALTNRTAVADSLRGVLADGSAGRVTVVACGERWTSVSNEPDSLRPGIEDLIGAGAIASALGDLRRSAEADVAAASFEGSEHRLMSWVDLGEIHHVRRRTAGEGAAIATGPDQREGARVPSSSSPGPCPGRLRRPARQTMGSPRRIRRRTSHR